MPLFLNNDDIEQVITMKDTMESLEILYQAGEGIAVGAPRSDLRADGGGHKCGSPHGALFEKHERCVAAFRHGGFALFFGYRHVAHRGRRNSSREAADDAGESLARYRPAFQLC